MQVSEFMTRGVESVGPDLSLRDAAGRMRSLNIGILPVCEGSRLIGILTDRDIVTRGIAVGMEPKQSKVRDVMTKDPVFCYADQEIAEVAKTMEQKKIRRIPVMGRDKKLLGMLSLGDFVKSSEGQNIVAELLEAVSVHH